MLDQLPLFESKAEKDNSPEDPTNINTFMLYYSDDELREIKKKSKKLFKASGLDNISDLILKLIQDEHARKFEQPTGGSSAEQPEPDNDSEDFEDEETNDGSASGIAEGQISAG